MDNESFSVVTGAFSYTGKYIAQRLLDTGKQVRTLTGHPNRTDPFQGKVTAMPFNFDNPDELTRSLEGANTLYNTYWVRFPRGEITHDTAVENTRTLIAAAKDAGVSRIVHISVTNASIDSPLPYFRGKALQEEATKASGLTYAIIRPALVFGIEDILINNIAWSLRKFPIFTMFGSGQYRVQPIYVGDFAEVVVEAGQQEGNVTIDAVGPDILTFEEMVRLLASKIGKSPRFIHMRPGLALAFSSLVGLFARDVVLTRNEIEGLMAELLATDSTPTGQTRLSDWLDENADMLGKSYKSELERHYDKL